MVSDRDTKQSMVKAYEDRGNVTPTFPIILLTEGGDQLQKLFDKVNYGGPTWMCHPKLTFDKTQYSESVLTKAIDEALNDDCNSTHISLEKKYFNSENIKIFKNELVLHVETINNVEINIISLNGKVIHSLSRKLEPGINKFTLQSQNIAKGMYFLDIKSANGVNFVKKVEFK